MSDSTPLPGDSFDLCVIGAGISGLSLAQMASSRLNLRTLVLERRDQAGGCLSSARFGAGEPAGWLELGAHTCYNSYVRFLDVMAGTDLLSRAVARKIMGFRIVERGVPRSIPACLNFLEVAMGLPRMLREPKAGQTAAAYYSRILGRKNWARVMHPMLNAVASQETEGFPADALFKKRASRRKDVLRSFAVRGGLGAAAQALAGLPGVHCGLDRAAVELTRTTGGFQVRTSLGETIRATRVALATPADAAAALLGTEFPELAGLVGRIETRTVKSLGVVVRDPLAHLPRLAGLILPEGPCFSAVSADTFPVPGMRAWTFHFDAKRMADDSEMLDFACQVLGVPRTTVAASFRRDHKMPSIAMGHDQWLAAVDRALPATGLMLAGNYLSGISIEDCVGRSLHEFERTLAGAPRT